MPDQITPALPSDCACGACSGCRNGSLLARLHGRTYDRGASAGDVRAMLNRARADGHPVALVIESDEAAPCNGGDAAPLPGHYICTVCSSARVEYAVWGAQDPATRAVSYDGGEPLWDPERPPAEVAVTYCPDCSDAGREPHPPLRWTRHSGGHIPSEREAARYLASALDRAGLRTHYLGGDADAFDVEVGGARVAVSVSDIRPKW